MTFTKIRQKIERCIARATVKAFLNAGYHITVNDGDEDTLLASTDRKAILKAMFTTDEDYLIVRNGDDSGWVRFVYGNDGWDVINDYTTNLEPVMKKLEPLIDKMEELCS